MQAPTKSEAEAWLEESSRYNQARRERNSHQNDDGSENLSGNEEVLEDSDERDEYPEEYEEGIEEDSQEQQEEGDNEEEEEELEDDEGEIEETEPQEELAENENHGEAAEDERRGHHASTKNEARLPYGSPVKRAHTANDHRRHTFRVLTSQREKSPFDSGKFMSERFMFERLTGKSLSPTKAPEEFLEYYEKFCKGFLLKKEEELEKKRRQKEEDELAQLQDKPTLISRPQVKPYVPLLERTPLLDARRERELEKIKQEKEDKLQREFDELTFKPKINPRSKNLASSPTRERIMNVYLRSRNQFSHSPLIQRKVDRDAFQPKINTNSRNIVAMRENASKDVVERLYHKADLGRAKKTELAKQLTPKFTPSLNKNTRKIARQIEANYYNEHNNDTKQLSESKREKRKRSEIESNRTSQLHYREESHLEQASDLELLDILKQFNSMLEQKNEVPINLHQLSSLMSAYSGKKKAGTDMAETVKSFKREHTEGYYEQYEDDHDQVVHRQSNTDRPMKSYPPAAAEDETNPMSNIEKNLMHIQDSLQDLKENGARGSESLSSLYNQAVHQNDLQSSSHSLNKTKKSKQNDHHRDGHDRDYNEYVESEVAQSKNSIMTGRNQHPSPHDKNTSAKSQKSSHMTPSKHDVYDAEEIKSVATHTRSAKKEDYSSPETQKTSRKRAQTTTKKTKKVKASPRFENESLNQIKTIKDAKSLNDVIPQTMESKNSLEGWNSQFEAHDHHNQFEEQRLVRENQPERKLKGHVVEHSFGGYPKDGSQGITQEDDNYRSNHPSEVSKPKSSSAKKSHTDSVKDKEKWRSSQALKEQDKGEILIGEDYERGKANSQAYIPQTKNQASQNSIAGSNKKSDRKEQSQKSSEKAGKEKRGREQEDRQHAKGSTSSRDQNKRYNNQEDKNSKADSDYEQEDRNRAGKGSRKVSFEQQSDSRRSSIFQEGSEDHNRHLAGQSKGKNSGYKKSQHDQGHHSEKISTFANKHSNKRQDEEHRASDDEVQSSIHGTPKVRSGDYMSFSANTLDQQPSFDDHQPPQNDRKVMEDDESEGSRVPSIKQAGVKSRQGSPSKQNRGHFEVVTTETIQIEPQSAPRFSYSMDGTDKAIPTASSSGLKAMAEQIVKKFKAYDAQIKQTAREYKMSVSPPRTASPSPEHNEIPDYEVPVKKEKEAKVFKSVEKGGVAKSSRNEIRPSKGSIPGSLSSVQSGVDRRLGKK